MQAAAKPSVLVECYPVPINGDPRALFPHAELIIHADDAWQSNPLSWMQKIEHELTDDPVFGIMTTWQMKEFFRRKNLERAAGKNWGGRFRSGTGLWCRCLSCGTWDITIYADITRWEIQLRFRRA